jgi:anti-sigma B factor antagonist
MRGRPCTALPPVRKRRESGRRHRPDQEHDQTAEEAPMLTFDDPTTTTTTTTATAEDRVLVLHGEIDVATGPAVRADLRRRFDEGEREVVVDLADVSFIDASGLGILVGAHRLYTRAGGMFRVRSPQRPVHRLFEITGLDRVLEG